MPIFYNEDIFDSGIDYEIGGFETNKTDNFTYADIYNEYRKRIARLIENYLSIATESYARQGYENPQEQARFALMMLIEDFLNVRLENITEELATEAIINSEQSTKWLYDIGERIKAYSLKLAEMDKGIESKMPVETELYLEAKQIIEDSSLEKLLERLSTIEL